MSRDRNSCTCERCRARGLMGPAILVTLGVLLLASEFSRWGFGDTWPVLLIVIGVIKVMQSNASTQGQPNYYPGYPGYPTAPPPVTPVAPPATTSQPDANQGQVTNG
jgi:Domain of unknown function (DUF5668)